MKYELDISIFPTVEKAPADWPAQFHLSFHFVGQVTKPILANFLKVSVSAKIFGPIDHKLLVDVDIEDGWDNFHMGPVAAKDFVACIQGSQVYYEGKVIGNVARVRRVLD